MRYKSTILLLIAVAITGLIAYSLSRRPTSEEAGRERGKLVPGLKADEVEEVVFQTGDQRIVCRRSGDRRDWAIAEPIRTRAETWAVEGFLDRLERADRMWSVFPRGSQKLRLADYGLKAPAHQVAVETGGVRHVVLFGGPTGTGDTVYAAVEGEAGVHAVESDLAQKADVTTFDLRSKTLAERIGTFDLNRVEIHAAGDTPFDVECRRAGEAWEVTAPLHDLADRAAVEGIANDLYRHRAAKDEFVADAPADLSPYGLDKPDLTLAFADEKQTQGFAFAGVESEGSTVYYARNTAEQAVVRVPDSLIAELRKGPADLRAKDLVDFELNSVRSVRATGPEGELVVAKQGSRWRIEGNRPADADTAVTEEVLRDLGNARVVRFPADTPDDLTPYGLSEDSRVQVALEGDQGRTLGTVCLGSGADEGTAYAMRPGYPAVLVVNRDRFYDRLVRGRLAFLNRRVLAEPAVEAVRVVSRTGGREFECTRDGPQAEWKLVRPVTGAADQEGLTLMLDALSDLEADEYAAEQAQDLDPYGLAEASAALTVTYAPAAGLGGAATPEQRAHSVLIGASAPGDAGRAFAKLAEDQRVFILPGRTVERLVAAPASRLVSAEPNLRGLTFRRGEAAVTFTYDTETSEWRAADGAELPAETDAAVAGAAQLLSRFQALRVADFMQKGPGLYGFDQPYLTVAIEAKTTSGKRVVIGRETEGGRFAAGPQSGFVLVVTPAQVQTLEAVFPPAGTPG